MTVITMGTRLLLLLLLLLLRAVLLLTCTAATNGRSSHGENCVCSEGWSNRTHLGQPAVRKHAEDGCCGERGKIWPRPRTQSRGQSLLFLAAAVPTMEEAEQNDGGEGADLDDRADLQTNRTRGWPQREIGMAMSGGSGTRAVCTRCR